MKKHKSQQFSKFFLKDLKTKTPNNSLLKFELSDFEFLSSK